MTEFPVLETHIGEWTTDDLDQLMESNRRFELIDGALLIPVHTTARHQTLMILLWSVLDKSCPPEYRVTHAQEIRISKTRSFIPDLLVFVAEAAARNPSRYAPDEVVLVSRTTGG